MKQKAVIHGQNLKSSDILLYLPCSFEGKLSASEKRYIKNAFYKAVLAYQKQEEGDYLDRMLI